MYGEAVLLVMQEVVCTVIAHVAKNTTTENRRRHMPVPVEYRMR